MREQAIEDRLAGQRVPELIGITVKLQQSATDGVLESNCRPSTAR